MKKNKHIGSSFDEFLMEEGILEEVEAAAIKAVIAYQLKQEMKKKNITNNEMAKQLKTSRSALLRLLDPKNPSVTLLTLSRAAQAVGRQLTITLSKRSK